MGNDVWFFWSGNPHLSNEFESFHSLKILESSFIFESDDKTSFFVIVAQEDAKAAAEKRLLEKKAKSSAAGNAAS